MDIIKKAKRNRKDNKVKGSTIFSAFFENKKLKPNIDEVSIPDRIGKKFDLLCIEFPPVLILIFLVLVQLHDSVIF